MSTFTSLLKSFIISLWLPICLLLHMWQPVSWVPAVLTICIIIVSLFEVAIISALGALARAPFSPFIAKLLATRRQTNKRINQLSYLTYSAAVGYMVLLIGFKPLMFAFALSVATRLVLLWKIESFPTDVMRIKR